MKTEYTFETTLNMGDYQHIVTMKIYNCRMHPNKWSWQVDGLSNGYLIHIARTKGRGSAGPFNSANNAMKNAEKHGVIAPEGFY